MVNVDLEVIKRALLVVRGKIDFVRPPVFGICLIEPVGIVQVIPVLGVVGDHITESFEVEFIADGHVEIRGLGANEKLRLEIIIDAPIRGKEILVENIFRQLTARFTGMVTARHVEVEYVPTRVVTDLVDRRIGLSDAINCGAAAEHEDELPPRDAM